MSRARLVPAVLLLAVLALVVFLVERRAPATAAPSAGMCPTGVTDCVDADLGDAPPADRKPIDGSRCLPDAEGCDDTPRSEEAATWTRADAEALLGRAEDELDADVRIARRGDEQFALTEDYRVGRVTVELGADDAGIYRVEVVTVEQADGPLVVTS